MRGYYGNARRRRMAQMYNPLAHLTGRHDTDVRRAAQFGIHIGEASIEPPTPAQRVWDQMKVGTVLTLSVVAAITAAKVLSPTQKRRRA